MPKTSDETMRGELNYHYHDYIEFLYALDTDAYVYLNGERHGFNTGDLVVINSNELHCLRFNSASHYVCVKFSPELLYSDEDSFFEYKYVVPFIHSTGNRKVFSREETERLGLSALTAEIMREWRERGAAYELIIRSDILRIFAGIFRIWGELGGHEEGREFPEEIKSALRYISQNYATVTAMEVARHIGFSYNHFSYAFHKSVGKTFSEYVSSLRLGAAEKLLISGDESITEIALACGFSTSSYFILQFRNRRGITPREFRERVRRAGT
jgi:AraC-like DNA-binding protein